MEPYLILGVSKDDSIEKIRKKYRKMCLLYHPDKIPNGATQEEKKQRTQMFQNINLCYERIMKEKGGQRRYIDDEEFDMDKEEIKGMMDAFLNSVYNKITGFTEHPLYRMLMSFGMKGFLNLIRKNKRHLSNIDVVDIDVELANIVGNCTIEFDYKSIHIDPITGEKKERVNHIKTSGVYPFILCKGVGDNNNDLIVNLKLKEKMIFSHDTKEAFVEELDDNIENKSLKTWYGVYLLKKNNIVK
jgi:DnaJ-class molecular chaperone